MTTLMLRSLTLRAGSRTLIDALTQTFSSGEIWCIAGPNGAGKTTLISAMAGLLRPASGTVLLDDTPVNDWRPEALARRRALMPQATNDAFSATVFDTLMLNRFPHLAGWGWESEADRVAAQGALSLLKLGDLGRRDVLSLSGGERQRVSLAATLCQEAPLLLLDEPLAHLDLHHQVDCLQALAGWVRFATGRCIVFSCHDLNLARRFATHALLLDGHGRAHAGPVRDVLTPERASAAFGFPLTLIQQDGHEALVPVIRSFTAGTSP